MKLPTSAALDAHAAKLEKAWPALWSDLLELRRLQHEASTFGVRESRTEAHVFDLDEYRRRSSGCHEPQDPEAA